MKSVTWLKEQIAIKQKEIEELEDLVASHPDAIREMLNDNRWKDHQSIQKLIESVSSIRTASGWTDSRKNPFEWYGNAFTFKGSDEVFNYRNGSNWCSEICDSGGIDIPCSKIQDAYYDNVQLLDEIAAMQPALAIGCLLYTIQGW